MLQETGDSKEKATDIINQLRYILTEDDDQVAITGLGRIVQAAG